jgi:hypothetical protein
VSAAADESGNTRWREWKTKRKKSLSREKLLKKIPLK